MAQRRVHLVVLLTVLVCAAGCSSGTVATPSAETTWSKSKVPVVPTTTKASYPTRPANATSIYDVQADYPCNNFIYNGKIPPYFAAEKYTADRMAEFRVILQAQCPQFLPSFETAAPQVAANVSEQSAALAAGAASASVAIASASQASESQASVQSSALANMQARDVLVAEGKFARGGSHLVGTEVQSGTWQSVDVKVENCYWEISDAQGNIIDNNFISVAPQFTIEIPASASGFTNTGCEFQWIQ